VYGKITNIVYKTAKKRNNKIFNIFVLDICFFLKKNVLQTYRHNILTVTFLSLNFEKLQKIIINRILLRIVFGMLLFIIVLKCRIIIINNK